MVVGLTLLRILLGFYEGPLSDLLSIKFLITLVVGGGAGGCGGAVYFFTEGLRAQGGWRKTMANVSALLVYCLILLGFVLWAVSRGW